MQAVPFTSVFPTTLGYIETECQVCEAYDEQLDASFPHPVFLSCNALWDTGAMRSTISIKVAKQLGLIATRQVKVFHADGVSIRNVYFVNILLPNKIEVKNVPVTDGDIEDTDILIGMDIISLCDFAITNSGKDTKFSFQIPSVLDIDFENPVSTGTSNLASMR